MLMVKHINYIRDKILKENKLYIIEHLTPNDWFRKVIYRGELGVVIETTRNSSVNYLTSGTHTYSRIICGGDIHSLGVYNNMIEWGLSSNKNKCFNCIEYSRDAYLAMKELVS